MRSNDPQERREALDLDVIAKEWCQPCGPCDLGLPMGCNHPDKDYRPVISQLIDEVERLRAGRDVEQQMLRNVPARLIDERRRTAEEIAQRCLYMARGHDANGFSAVGDAYAQGARIAREVGGSE